MVEDPLSEQLLHREFRAGQIVIVDATDEEPEEAAEDQDDAGSRSKRGTGKANGRRIVFKAVEGFEPPPAVEEMVAH